MLSSGCVLADPASDFPFTPHVLDDDTGTTPEPDAPAPSPPSLMFTEVMFELLTDADSATPPPTGEYIEVKNVGSGPADPRDIVLFLTNLDNFTVSRIRAEVSIVPEEQEAYNALQPIEPGEYFVFIRHHDSAAVTDALPPGSFYDYGRFNTTTLPHTSVEVKLDLGYQMDDGSVSVFDTLRWRGENFQADSIEQPAVRIVSGAAIELDASIASAEENDDPTVWCVSSAPLGANFGTPGGPGNCDPGVVH